MTERQLPHFHSWKNIEEGYQTKTALKSLGLKPKDVDKYDATLKAYAGGKWKDFVLYKVDNCLPIKKAKVNELDMTDENIAEALYIINKSAKKSRDTKNENYSSRNHSVVKRSKQRQVILYELKDQVINKLLCEGKASIKGYHKQNEHQNCLLLIEFKGLTFHLPSSNHSLLSDLKELGEIGIISATSRKTRLKFNESMQLLKNYVEHGGN